MRVLSFTRGSAGRAGLELETPEGDYLEFDPDTDTWHVGLAYGQGAGVDWAGPFEALEDALELLRGAH